MVMLGRCGGRLSARRAHDILGVFLKARQSRYALAVEDWPVAVVGAAPTLEELGGQTYGRKQVGNNDTCYFRVLESSGGKEFPADPDMSMESALIRLPGVFVTVDGPDSVGKTIDGCLAAADALAGGPNRRTRGTAVGW